MNIEIKLLWSLVLVPDRYKEPFIVVFFQQLTENKKYEKLVNHDTP